MGRRAQRRRSTARRSTSAVFASGRGVATNYIAPSRPRRSSSRRSACSSTTRPGSPAGAPFPPAAPSPRRRLDRRAAVATARRRRCACACIDGSVATGIDKYGLNAYIYDSRRRRQDALRPRPVLAHQGRRRLRRRPQGGPARRRQGQDRRRQRAARQDRRVPGQGRAARARPLAGPAVPHVGDARERDLAELAGRAGLHGHVRGLRRRALPVLAGRRLRGPRVRDRQRGDLHRSRAPTGSAPTTR